MAALFMALFGRLLDRWREMLAALLGIVVYAVLAGAAGVVRAAIMGGLSIFAVQIGRLEDRPSIPAEMRANLSFCITG